MAYKGDKKTIITTNEQINTMSELAIAATPDTSAGRRRSASVMRRRFELRTFEGF